MQTTSRRFCRQLLLLCSLWLCARCELSATVSEEGASCVARSVDAFANPPAQLQRIFSFLPGPLQLRVLEQPTPDFPKCLYTPSLPQLLQDAQLLHPLLQKLKRRAFFRIFKLPLQQRSCSLKEELFLQQRQLQQSSWKSSSLLSTAQEKEEEEDDGATCSAPERCGLCHCADSEVPSSWRQKPEEEFVDRRHAASFYRWREFSRPPDAPFSRLQGAEIVSSTPAPSPAPVYVDLIRNPPGYTTYQGGAIWRILYKQIEQLRQREKGEELKQSGEQEDDDDDDEMQCSSSKALRLVVSGMQSNISALAAEYFYSQLTFPASSASSSRQQTQAEEELESMQYSPAPNVDFFVERFGDKPERIKSLYFAFSLLLRAVCALRDVLQECSCETGNSADDLAARAALLQLLEATASKLNACTPEFQRAIFEEDKLAFLSDPKHADALLGCVSCEKCQLHGTIKLYALRVAAKSAGLGRALPSLERNEVTALLNALFYFADSILALERMRMRVATQNFILILTGCLAALLFALAVWRAVCSTLTKVFSKFFHSVQTKTRRSASTRAALKAKKRQ